MKNPGQEFDPKAMVVVLFQMEANKDTDGGLKITTVILICFTRSDRTERPKVRRYPRHYRWRGPNQKYRYEL